MASLPPSVLLVDDDATFRRVTEMQLAERGYRVLAVGSAAEGLHAFSEQRPAVVVTDVRMPDRGGLEFLADLRAADPEALVIVMTAYADVETTVRTFRGGAFDFLSKPFSRDLLFHTLDRALEVAGLRRENLRLRTDREREQGLGALVGAGAPMARVRDLIARAGAADATVLITGESGTGKELAARALHLCSRRARGPFVAVHCGALPDTLVESEMFGHVAGAFTGAVGDRRGRFEEADGGTIFLDEIATMSPDLQHKLLRVVEDRDVRPVGAARGRRVDVRIIAATNADLSRARAEGRFREDLFFRLNVVRIEMPPLRDHIEDAPLIAKALLARHGRAEVTLSDGARRALGAHHWPGNVRELQNVVERALISLGERAALTEQDLAPLDAAPAREPAPPHGGLRVGGATLTVDDTGVNLADLQRALLRLALDRCAGNQTRAARFLGITRQALLYRLRKHGLAPDS